MTASNNEPRPDDKVYDLSGFNPSAEFKKVLLVEDQVDFADTLRVFLEEELFQVTCVKDGVEGMRQIMAADFDVILCDLVMPHLPGDMFYFGVERVKPHLGKRFVFITGHRADPKWDAFLRRVDGVVLWKPFPMRDLLNAIRQVLTKAGGVK